MNCGPYSVNYHVVDVYPDGTVVMEDEEHEVRIVDMPDGTSIVQANEDGEWVDVTD